MSAVVSVVEIKERIKLGANNRRSMAITPVPLPKDFDADAVDLRLGQHFFVPRSHRAPCFCPGVTEPVELYYEEYVALGGYLVLQAHSTVLAATLEFIKLPYDMSGQILTKSSWARTFITVETAPWIHPSYRGCLTLEIANASNTPIILYPGVKIAQLVLFHYDAAYAKQEKGGENGGLEGFGEDATEEDISGSFIGPIRPEAGKLRCAPLFLRDLGIPSHQVEFPSPECVKDAIPECVACEIRTKQSGHNIKESGKDEVEGKAGCCDGGTSY